MNPRMQLILNIMAGLPNHAITAKAIVDRSEKRLWMGDIRQMLEHHIQLGNVEYSSEFLANGDVTKTETTPDTNLFRLTVRGHAQFMLHAGEDFEKNVIFGTFEPTTWPSYKSSRLGTKQEEVQQAKAA